MGFAGLRGGSDPRGLAIRFFSRRPADKMPLDIADLRRRHISQFEMFLLMQARLGR
jgi:hypothetical protein